MLGRAEITYRWTPVTGFLIIAALLLGSCTPAIVGGYHFYETNDEPGAQLEHFTGIAKWKSGDLPPVIDIEKLHHQDDWYLVENLETFLLGLESHYGVKPIIYSGLNFANRYMMGFGDYPLRLAEYEAAEPTLPHGWSDWTFWQWSQTAKVGGIGGYVDADRYNGSELSFRNLLINKDHLTS